MERKMVRDLRVATKQALTRCTILAWGSIRSNKENKGRHTRKYEPCGGGRLARNGVLASAPVSIHTHCE